MAHTMFRLRLKHLV